MMKGFSNAFRIPELRQKILITLGLVFVCRLVSQIPTPGVDWQALQKVIETARETSALFLPDNSQSCAAVMPSGQRINTVRYTT
jgi:preprotein translocase subunit SecY